MGKGSSGRLQGQDEARAQSSGLQASDLLSLPEPLPRLLNWMIRQDQVSFSDVVTFLGQGEAHANAILNDLLKKEYIRAIQARGGTSYRVRLAPKRGKTMPANLRKALEDGSEYGDKG